MRLLANIKDKISAITKSMLGPPITVGSMPTAQSHWGLVPRDLPPFTFQTIRIMLWDPTVRLALAMRKAPIANAELAYRDGEKWISGVKADRPEVAAFVEQQINRFWKNDLPSVLDAQTWGWSGGEVTYKLGSDRCIEYDGLLTRHASEIRALESKGGLVGVRFKNLSGTGRNGADLFLPKAFWHAYMPENGLRYGLSALRGCYSPWADKWLGGMALDVRRLYMHKDAYGGSQLKYPTGTTPVPDVTGTLREIPNSDIAQQIVNQRAAGGTITLPSGADAAGNALWEWKDATVGASPTHILQYPKDLDVEILRGLEIPDDVLTSESTGAWAGKKVPAQAFYTGLTIWGNMLLSDFVKQVVEWLVLIKFGRAEEFEASLKPLAIQANEQAGESKQPGGGNGGGFQGNPFAPNYGPQYSQGSQGQQGQPKRMSIDVEAAVGSGLLDAAGAVRQARRAMRRRLSQGHGKG